MMKKGNIEKSIFRDNIGLTIGLLVMYTIMIILVFFSSVLPGSLKRSYDEFLVDYCLADAWINVMPGNDYPVDELKKIDHLAEVCPSFALDADIKFKGNENCSARIFTVSDTDLQRFYAYDGENVINTGSLYISQRFASIHSICVGDIISVMTPSGQKDLPISGIITTPESMVCARDDFSRNDSYDFCYLYIPSVLAEKTFGTGGIVNRFSLYFDDGTTIGEMESAIDEAEDIIGPRALSSVIYETSQFKYIVESEMTALPSILKYMVLVIFFVGVCFSSLFICQIVEKERRTIGLLRALGFSKSRVVTLFIQYAGILSIAAALIGITIGYILVETASDIFLLQFSVPEFKADFETGRFLIFLLMYFAAVLLSNVFSLKKVVGIDPSEAYSGAIQTDKELPGWFSKSKIPVLIKITSASIVRHTGRFLASSFCISACVMLLVMSISTKASEKQGEPAVFGGRYRYDVMLRTDGKNFDINSVSEKDFAEDYTEYIAFSERISFGEKGEEVQINAIPDETNLLVLSDAKENRLYPSDGGILLDDWFARRIGAGKGDIVKVGDTELEVTGILYEYIDTTQYINERTAELLGYSTQNTVIVKLREGADETKALNEMKQIPGVYFGTLINSYKQSYLNNIGSMEFVLNIFTVLSILLGIIIIYNMVILKANEKRLEYATLLALGIWNKEILSMAFVENILEYIFAIAFAFFTGRYASVGLMEKMGASGRSYPVYHLGESFLTACLFSLLFVFAGVLITIIKVKKIDPALSLNIDE